MNTQTDLLSLVNAEAAIERLDAIAQTVEAPLRGVPCDRDLEGHGVIRLTHAHRCLGPG